MDLLCVLQEILRRIGNPHITDTIHDRGIKLSCSLIIFRWIAAQKHDPSLRKRMIAYALVLQKCKHRCHKCITHRCELIDQQDSLRLPLFHTAFHLSQDIRHRIFRYLLSLQLRDRR